MASRDWGAGAHTRGRKSNHAAWKWWILILGLILAHGGLLLRLYRNIVPSIVSAAKVLAESTATDIMNAAMGEALAQYSGTAEDLVVYYRDTQGNIVACGVDTVAINTISTVTLNAMNAAYSEAGDLTLYIPMGQVTGNPLLTAFGPDIPVKLRPIGNSGINYHQEFKAAGINQVNHRVWLQMEFIIQIMAPLITDELKVTQDFVLVDRTFAGEVPDAYLQFPQDGNGYEPTKLPVS